MNSQSIQHINLKDLVLWTENPRDPIDTDASDQDILFKAMSHHKTKWNLKKFASEMGPHFDSSELPTIVFYNDIPVVFDGNRRVILGKIKHGILTTEGLSPTDAPSYPLEIPCNVCDKKTALENVLRKHADSGSWQPLERDIFLHRHMGHSKSIFLSIEEATGLISSNPDMNKGFVKKEVLKEETLKKLGLSVRDGSLLSIHNTNETDQIFSDIAQKIRNKDITTRASRGQTYEVLSPEIRRVIDANVSASKNLKPYADKNNEYREPTPASQQQKRLTRRTKLKEKHFFGEKLYLRYGHVADLYRDMCDLHQFYLTNKSTLSSSFPKLIRMSMRLLCEAAAKDQDKKLAPYVDLYFKRAKAKLDQNTKTSLSSQNVTESSLVQLLQSGAHDYTATANTEQTIAISVIVGAMLTISHGTDK